jgi:hypothetical protein
VTTRRASPCFHCGGVKPIVRDGTSIDSGRQGARNGASASPASSTSRRTSRNTSRCREGSSSHFASAHRYTLTGPPVTAIPMQPKSGQGCLTSAVSKREPYRSHRLGYCRE